MESLSLCIRDKVTRLSEAILRGCSLVARLSEAILHAVGSESRSTDSKVTRLSEANLRGCG